jgi:hypothetical protein
VILSAYSSCFSNFKKANHGLIGLAVLVVNFFPMISTNEAYEAMNVGPNVSQWIGGGIMPP